MRALTHDPAAPHGLRFDDREPPKPAPHQALVRVTAISLNLGDATYLAGRPAGSVPGWDAAGIVVAPAADGSGPAAGARVVTFDWSDGWAEHRAVDTSELAVVPDGVELEDAAALPVAGVTALRAVRRLGSLHGRAVLVTGASGGVGRYAVQLAALAGARVVAAVGRPERAAGLTELGAHRVVVDLAELDAGEPLPLTGAIDTVGGDLLPDVLLRVAPGGLVVAVGSAAGRSTTLDVERIRVAGGATLEAFAVGPRFGPDLEYLLHLVATGALDVAIGRRGSWDDVHEAVQALLDRSVPGKAVLRVQS
jgi:NADPH:quinone reductase